MNAHAHDLGEMLGQDRGLTRAPDGAPGMKIGCAGIIFDSERMQKGVRNRVTGKASL